MTLHEQDLDAILERSVRVNGFTIGGTYQDLGTIASVVREDVPALVAELRRTHARIAKLAAALEEIAGPEGERDSWAAYTAAKGLEE